jgi:hypothetical protein
MQFSLNTALVLPTMGLIGALHHNTAPATQPEPQRLVAEAQIWADTTPVPYGPYTVTPPDQGYAYLPVTIHGHTATICIMLNKSSGLTLSTTALAQMGVTLTDTTQLDSITIGSSDVQHKVPITINRTPNWTMSKPGAAPTVIGSAGVKFITAHYDVLYDFSGRRLRLYAFPAHPMGTHAWLPSGLKPSDCGRLIPIIPVGTAGFTAMEVGLDGRSVTGVLEMEPYDNDEKMNQEAFEAMKLPAQSPRIQPVPGEGKNQVMDVHITVGSDTVWTGPVKVFSELQIARRFPPKTPIMLINLGTIKNIAVFNSISSNKVCLHKA